MESKNQIRKNSFNLFQILVFIPKYNVVLIFKIITWYDSLIFQIKIKMTISHKLINKLVLTTTNYLNIFIIVKNLLPLNLTN